MTQIRGRKPKSRPGQPPTPEELLGVPSLGRGFKGLNTLAGNQALAAMLARKGSTMPFKQLDDDKDESLRSLEEDEQALAALRSLIDEHRGVKGYEDLRKWLIALLEAMHEALAGAEDYEDELEELLDQLYKLPNSAGQNREEWLKGLAQLFHKEAEELHEVLRRQLPATADVKRLPLTSRGLSKKLSSALKGELEKLLPAVQRDEKADDEAAMLGGLGLGALALGGRRKKRKRKR